tara:strand:- start:1497 stop:2717 length:1221 start_codon:yes stop_codon:yes gene_type:complete
MNNINVKTHPTGRSPKGKFYFGENTIKLCKDRPKDCQIGDMLEYELFAKLMKPWDYAHKGIFRTCGIDFGVATTSANHHKFVGNMFRQNEWPLPERCDWTIYHNMEIKSNPKVYINLDEKEVLIAGTSFFGEIKKCVFTIIGYSMPLEGRFPMHCSAFEYNDNTALMFGLSGTGKTTLSADPEYQLIGDDEIVWDKAGLTYVETGCYAKTEGLNRETQPTIFQAMDNAREQGLLIEENVTEPNARSSYPIGCVPDAITDRASFDHPKDVFFLALDATGTLPAVSKIEGDTIKRLFETGYTSKMPGTEDGIKEIQKVYSPCYGGPFMPLPVKTYSDMLIERVEASNSNVFLVNTGMNKIGSRFPLDTTRAGIKQALSGEYTTKEIEWTNPIQPCEVGTIKLHELTGV